MKRGMTRNFFNTNSDRFDNHRTSPRLIHSWQTLLDHACIANAEIKNWQAPSGYENIITVFKDNHFILRVHDLVLATLSRYTSYAIYDLF